MKSTWVSLAAVLLLGTMVAGCSGGGNNTNVAENADAKAMADYEAAVKAEQDAANGQMDTSGN